MVNVTISQSLYIELFWITRGFRHFIRPLPGNGHFGLIKTSINCSINESHVPVAEELQKKLSGDIVSCDNAIAPLTGFNFHVDIDKEGKQWG